MDTVAVRRYGKDYHAMAEVVGNKTVNQCRNFFVNYRRRFNLLQILEEYEAKHGVMNLISSSHSFQVGTKFTLYH